MENERFITCRKFYVTVISAQNVPDNRTFFKMKVYAKISFCGAKKTEKKTRADKHNEANPSWNYTTSYTLAEDGVRLHGLVLVIKLYSKQKLGDHYIGEVHSHVPDLFNHAANMGGCSAVLSRPLQRGAADIDADGCGGGPAVLNFSFAFGEPFQVAKPKFWEKALRAAAALALRVTLVSFVGFDVAVPILPNSDIVHAENVNR